MMITGLRSALGFLLLVLLFGCTLERCEGLIPQRPLSLDESRHLIEQDLPAILLRLLNMDEWSIVLPFLELHEMRGRREAF